MMLPVQHAAGDMGPPPSQSTLAQLSYAPTVQTTVVTTTTTTTTSFPPFVLKAPRNLNERDPELYPLASTPTPQSLRRLRLDVDGRSACFEEAPDTDQKIEEYQQEQASLQSNNGIIRSVKSTAATYSTPNRVPRQEQLRHPEPQTLLDDDASLRKHSTTPMSMPAATELQGFHRPRRTSRPPPGQLDLQGIRLPGHGQAYDLDQRSASIGFIDSGTGHNKDLQDFSIHPQRPSAMFPTPSLQRQRRGHELSHLDDTEKALPVLRSTTPPSADSDFESFELPEPHLANRRRRAPLGLLDTSPFQETSLPSPSLSPTTAAANLHRSISSSRLRVVDSEEPDHSPPRLGPIDEMLRRPRERSYPGQSVFSIAPESSLAKLQPAPSFTDIPSMLDSFDTMPDSLKTYVMYQFLRRCSKPTLRFVADIVNPAVKCDFLGRLPLELSLQILKHLDAKSMCRAAQVSKKWRLISNSDETAWKNLLAADGFQVPEGEIQRAVEEGWGWQIPYGHDACEINLSSRIRVPDAQASCTASPSVCSAPEDFVQAPSPPRKKRKATSKYSSHKKQKKKALSTTPLLSPAWLSSLENSQGPNAYANAAVLAVPDPKVGLPSLSNLHLFKSVYQRHHQIRQSWMDPDTKPRHLAFRAHQRHVVTCLQFDSEKIITGSDDANIDMYDTQSGASLKRLQGHEGGVWALEYQGNILVSGSTDRSVRIWNIDEGRCLHVFQGHTSTVRCLQVVQPVKIGENQDGTPVLMPKQPLIITGSRDSTCRVWKLPKPDDVSFFQAGPTENDFDNPYFVRALTGHGHSVRAIAAWGDTLVSGSYDSTVRVWKISTGETLHRLLGHSTKVYSVVLDHERGRCISGSMDNLVKVWSLETGHCLFNLDGHTSLVGLLDLRDDCLVSAAADSTLRIWDPENGRCKHVLSAHTGAITCFSHDGQKVISGSDRTLKMWNTKTGECVRDLLTDLSGVWQIRFDERRCIAAVQRNDWTYIEVLDFGAYRDGMPEADRGRRVVVNSSGDEINDDWHLHRVTAVDDNAPA